jgi:hypothetical protein
LPYGKPVTLKQGGVSPHGKSVSLNYDPRKLGLVGNNVVTSWRVKAARVMANGKPGSSDHAPDKGWYR